jgi:hypothetical protein
MGAREFERLLAPHLRGESSSDLRNDIAHELEHASEDDIREMTLAY